MTGSSGVPKARRSIGAALLAGLLLAGRGAVAAEPSAESFPPVVALEFRGNDTTRERILLQEIALRPGDPATPAAIERARQAILDLGLFNSVEASTQRTKDGVRVLFEVQEKLYILPVPRLGVSSDHETTYGFELEWNNVGGLNQTLELLWENEEKAEPELGRQESFGLEYDYPLVGGSPWGIELAAEYKRTPISEDGPAGARITYRRLEHEARVLVTRAFGERTSATRGWRAGAGVLWDSTELRGSQAPAEPGRAMAALAVASYRDVRFRVYSEAGVSYSLSLEEALPGVSNDFDYRELRFSYRRFLDIGSVPHQSLYLYFDAASRHGGPRGVDAFGLGGGGSLRGFEKNVFDGDAFYRFSAELLRPLPNSNSVRAMLLLDAGNAFRDLGKASLDRVHANIGLGLRWRVKWFVDVEIDVGVAWPIEGGEAQAIASSTDLF